MMDEALLALLLPEDKLREARGIVEDLLYSTFPNTTFTSIELKPDLDHYGDPVLRVDMFYRGSDAEIAFPASGDVGLNLWRRLRGIGILVFPVHTFRNVDAEPYGACS